MGKRKTEEQLHTEAAAREINEGVSNIVEGSLDFDEASRKQTCVIVTKTVDDEPNTKGETRQVYTSDLFQTFYTKQTKIDKVKANAKERRAKLRAAADLIKEQETAAEDKVEIVVADAEAA